MFDDRGLLAFGGVNGSGDVDLVSPVDGRFVIPNTTTQGLTDSVIVEAGFADPGNETLFVYGLDGSVLSTRANGLDGIGPDGRSLISITLPTFSIASFRIASNDTFGVDQITFDNLISAGASPAPEPSSIAAFAFTGLGAAGLMLRARRRKIVA